jgi:hypothetical protein
MEEAIQNQHHSGEGFVVAQVRHVSVFYVLGIIFKD